MNIGDKWRIVSDPLNVILQKFEKQGQRGDGWKSVSYHATPKDALKYYVNMEILSTGLEDFKVVCEKIDELNTTIEGLKL